ncbi:GTP-binding protein HSR1 [Leucothrix sargassi]|nr:GTP-binding protein HSR1 [Leucothrix sargassi]
MVTKYNNYRYDELSEKSNTVGIKFDVMVTGVTGAGKSTTLNALFQKTVTKVGKGVEPETMQIDSFELNDAFRLWDTPGLGDGIERDKKHSKKIVELLGERYDGAFGFIDLVLVVIEGSNRDMGTTYKLLNEVIIPNFPSERILVAINQADLAMKGRYWDHESNKPNEKLEAFLVEQSKSITRRVKEATGVGLIQPVFYSAEKHYNLDKVFDLLIDNMPMCKRSLS